ncbi:MAG: glycosyltransferase, partial [Saprospiraceae bacterium]
FEELLIAGDGPERAELERLAEKAPVRVKVLGFQSRSQLDEMYAKSHFVILPSENEGFPKVIAEAGAHGCIPIVTDVSCIGQYVREGENGFLLADNAPQTIKINLEKIGLVRSSFPSLSGGACVLAKAFSYERYLSRIRETMTF